MAIEKLTKEKALRPSAIDTIDKLNEIVDVVNNFKPTDTSKIKEDIAALQLADSNIKSDVTKLQTADTSIKADVSKLQSSDTSNKADIAKIKTTLYTPLSNGDE